MSVERNSPECSSEIWDFTAGPPQDQGVGENQADLSGMMTNKPNNLPTDYVTNQLSNVETNRER